MKKQSTATVVMVRPDHFGFNAQTAETNPFQHIPEVLHKNNQEIRNAVLFEFEQMVKILKKHGIEVLVLPSRKDIVTPDAVFPNNWFSHHEENKLILYPMLTPNRRLERQADDLLSLFRSNGIANPEIVDLTKDEERGLTLESTGSIVLDRVHKVAFAMASPRTSKKEFEKWCDIMRYKGIFVHSTNHHDKETYHTNLHMSIGSEFAVVCFDVIEDKREKNKVRKELIKLQKEIIEISLEQVHSFCGNILEVQSNTGGKIVVMSETAQKEFTKEQLRIFKKTCKIVPIAVPVIEKIGGGGVRCMMAEIFKSN